MPKGHLARLIFFAGLPLTPNIFLASCLLLSISTWLFLTIFFKGIFSLIFAAIGFCLPFIWADRRSAQRAEKFSVDYPIILNATASSLKAGLTPEVALERSIRLLPSDSAVKSEVVLLLNRLRQGFTKELAVEQFAPSINLPELSLFRTAFTLVLKNGGSFSPTLDRLAKISHARLVLISKARVSTATMKMTGNILLVIAPMTVLMISAQNKEFWETFYNNPTANSIASSGILIIVAGYLTLLKMSRFRP